MCATTNRSTPHFVTIPVFMRKNGTFLFFAYFTLIHALCFQSECSTADDVVLMVLRSVATNPSMGSSESKAAMRAIFDSAHSYASKRFQHSDGDCCCLKCLECQCAECSSANVEESESEEEETEMEKEETEETEETEEKDAKEVTVRLLFV